MATDLGRDISCTTSLRTGRYATGAKLVGEAAYRRLTTPRGMLKGGEEEENYGIDLPALIGSTNPKSSTASLEGRIRSELTKDERILTCKVVCSATTGTDGSVSVAIAISCTTDRGPFVLKLAVSAVTVTQVGLTA